MVTNPSTIQEVGIILGHMQEQLSRLLNIAERSATKDEVRAADDGLSKRCDANESDVRALQTRVRALEDAKTATDSLVSTVKWLVGIVGGSGILLLLRWLAVGSG